MYKMKEVCAKTGLTEKAVRFYMDEKLLTPETETGLHYKSYRFSERDIQRLRDIAALRSAEFSIADIRTMLENPAAIPALVSEREALLTAKIAEMRSVQSALSNLKVPERTDVAQVADAIEPRSPLRKETPKAVHNRPLWLAIYLALFSILGALVGGWMGLGLMLVVLLLLAGLHFPIMAIGYFAYNHRYIKMENRAQAKVLAVVSDEGTADAWELSTWDTVYGLMNRGFLHWNWVRPDHWVPMLQYEVLGETVIAAYRYGGMKRSWQVGDTVAVAWKTGKEKQVYPCNDAVLNWKAGIYGLAGILGMLAFALFVWQVVTK